jgi:hypothetical protein
MLNDTKPAGSYIGKTRDMTKVWNTYTIFYSHFEYTGAFRGFNLSSIDVNGYVMQHFSPL